MIDRERTKIGPLVVGISQGVRYDRAGATTSKLGQADAESSRGVDLEMTRASVLDGRVADATAVPATSCAQVTFALGVIASKLLMNIQLRLFRGRNIRRCAPSCTSSR